ncbi:hypothetical protein CYMTET_12860, partial [Cymbomonas tetramitiformis]
CLCAALWTGKFCTDKVTFAKPRAMTNFTPYNLPDLTMNQVSLANKTSVMVSRNPMSKDRGPPIKLADVTKAMLKVLPESDPLRGVMFRTCSVIGSSGILLMYEHGGAIDQSDAIIRFNSAPTEGFQPHVGSRTTLRITNSRNFGFREFPSEQVFQHMRITAGLNKMLEKRRRHPTMQLYGLSPDFHQYIDRSFQFLATSGLLGIVIALHKCVSVNLYGFQVHPRHGVQYHYYNKADAPANEQRDDVEWLVVKALVTGGVLNFGEPCIIECHTSELWCESCQKSLDEPRKGSDG